MLTLGRETI